MKSERLIIVCDLDDTLINTAEIKILLNQAFANLGFSEAAVNEARATVKKIGVYAPLRHVAELDPSLMGTWESEWQQIQAAIPSLLFPETLPFLSRCQACAARMCLLSRGDTSYQHAKLLASGLATFFKEVHYTEDDKGTYLKKTLPTLHRFVFIDDNAQNRESVLSTFPHATAYASVGEALPLIHI